MIVKSFASMAGKRINLLLLISFAGIMAISLLLTACGDATATAPPTTQKTNTATTDKRAIAQPKVVGSGTDAQGGKIDFTEPPVLNDGVPGLLFFETEN